LRDEIYAITLDWPRYGYRSVSRELRRRGIVANEKRVRRIMREEGLLRRRRSARGLPYRKHNFPTYPNLAKCFIQGKNDQLWVVDFTYVRLFGSFVFIAIVLDAFSRRCIGRAEMPSDNAICERFMRTLKDDEIRIRDYTDFADTRRSIAKFLNVTYNPSDPTPASVIGRPQNSKRSPTNPLPHQSQLN